MKGSTKAKPQLLSACNHTRKSLHLGSCSMAPGPLLSVTPGLATLEATTGLLFYQLVWGPYLTLFCVLFLFPTLSFPVIHMLKELTIATLDPLESGWNNELPSKILTHIWQAATDRASVTERAVCHQWTARCLSVGLFFQSWTLTSFLAFLKIPLLCSIPYPLPLDSNTAIVARGQAVRPQH